jgi:hypothetical protein
MIVLRNSIVRAALVTVGVMMIPLWGSFLVDDWNWGWQAFVIWGAVVFIAALTYQLAVRGVSNKAYRIALGLAVTAALLLFWFNFVLAVEASLANFTYFGVIFLGIIGAAIARLRARGMALALGGMAIAQLLVPFIAPIFWRMPVAVPVFGVNGMSIVLFAISAMSFRRAARAHKMSTTH